jgi:hypothetical protein
VIHATLAGTAITISIIGVVTKASERIRRLASLLFVTVIMQTVVGDVIYPIYLARTKPVLVTLNAGSRSIADIFDVKEHLAFFALVLVIGLFALTRASAKPTPLVRTIFGCVHGCIVLTAVLGAVVASVRMP